MVAPVIFLSSRFKAGFHAKRKASFVKLYRFILRSCDRKFVFERVAVVNVIVARELSQWPNLCLQMFVGGLEIVSQKSSHRGNSETNYLSSNKSVQKICCSCFKALSIMKVFSLKELWHEATLPKKNIICEHLKEDITLICGQKPNYGCKSVNRFFWRRTETAWKV